MWCHGQRVDGCFPPLVSPVPGTRPTLRGTWRTPMSYAPTAPEPVLAGPAAPPSEAAGPAPAHHFPKVQSPRDREDVNEPTWNSGRGHPRRRAHHDRWRHGPRGHHQRRRRCPQRQPDRHPDPGTDLGHRQRRRCDRPRDRRCDPHDRGAEGPSHSSATPPGPHSAPSPTTPFTATPFTAMPSPVPRLGLRLAPLVILAS